MISESAFNDAKGAIVTFAVLAVAIGSGKSLLTAYLIDLLKQAGIGVLVGIVVGYFAALLIAHEKLDFLAEYTPLVTLMAVIGAYLGADGFQACGFMAVFVFGLMNKHLLGGVFVVTVFMFVARPITIFCCALPDKRAKWSMNELLFMC